MKIISLGRALAVLALGASSLVAQLPFTSEGDPRAGAGFSLAASSGALAWALPVGTVPGAIPVPVVFRYQASMTTTLTQGGSGERPSRPVLRYRGIWASLHFGFIAPSQNLGPGQTQEGVQILEDGMEFRDRDWLGRDLSEALPLAFGFRAPAGGYARELSGTYGLYDAVLSGLGRWEAKVARLTGANRFKVLLDQDRARIYGYHDALKAFVPVLWVDRAGAWVEFRWRGGDAAGTTTFTVQVLNADRQGVQVAWAAQLPGTGPGELLRADFIGLPAPSLQVEGFAGVASILPSSLDAPAGAEVRPVSLAVGGPVGRPTQVRLGTPDCQPDFGPDLPLAPAQSGFPMQAWHFTYADATLADLRALRAPSGAQPSPFRAMPLRAMPPSCEV